MSTSEFKLKILGTRGSMAVDGDEYAVFGGATSCYLVQAGEESVFLDAGSGMVNAPSEFSKTPVILISHPHLDHILGLGMYRRLSEEGVETRICLPAKNAEEARKILGGIYSPPFWPVSFEQYLGDIRIDPLVFPIRLGELLIEGIKGNHPGGCEIIKLTYKGRSLVYVTDYEFEERSFAELKDFARNAEVILYDGQYEPEEAEQKKGFGHSTAVKGIELMKTVGAGLLLLVHHDPLSTDDVLLKRERELGLSNVRYARQGETVQVDMLS